MINWLKNLVVRKPKYVVKELHVLIYVNRKLKSIKCRFRKNLKNGIIEVKLKSGWKSAIGFFASPTGYDTIIKRFGENDECI